MKKLLFLIFALVLSYQNSKAQVVLDANSITIKWTGKTVPSPYFVKASPRGSLEWFAIISDATKSKITDYAKNIPSGIAYFTPTGNSTPIPFNNIVTSLLTSMDSMFLGATSFNQNIGSWDVSKVTNMNRMFYEASSFNQPIGNWNVSNVTDMKGLFYKTTAFNQPIDYWNVSKVTNMKGLFYKATAFNQPIGSWDVSKVTNMNRMFYEASSFNQPIGNWNVSRVINMSNMFYGASDFNQPIGSWDVSRVMNMSTMFSGTAFNHPIGGWNVSNVTDMYAMFYGASDFNQNISAWNVSNVKNMTDMFTEVKLSTEKYDSILIGWSKIDSIETPLKRGVIFSGGKSNYCKSESARNTLVSSYGWTITDSGLNCSKRSNYTLLYFLPIWFLFYLIRQEINNWRLSNKK